jgi:hypothetical protein
MGPVEDRTIKVFDRTGGLLAHRLDLGTLTGAPSETVFTTDVAPAGCVLVATIEGSVALLFTSWSSSSDSGV